MGRVLTGPQNHLASGLLGWAGVIALRGNCNSPRASASHANAPGDWCRLKLPPPADHHGGRCRNAAAEHPHRSG